MCGLIEGLEYINCDGWSVVFQNQPWIPYRRAPTSINQFALDVTFRPTPIEASELMMVWFAWRKRAVSCQPR